MMFLFLSLISWEEIGSQNRLPSVIFSYKNDMTCFGMEFDKIDASIWFKVKNIVYVEDEGPNLNNNYCIKNCCKL
jgi:hypothetical protein